jgi:hypothetical protein
VGRKSREKRERREGRPPKLDTRAPWWSVYTRVWSMLSRIDRTGPAHEWPLLTVLKHGHVFYVDPIQASAAPIPERFSTDLLPFEAILLATGEASGDPKSPPYAALLMDQRHLAEEMEDEPAWPIILPIYTHRTGLLKFPGMCVLGENGDLMTSDFAAMVEAGHAYAGIRETPSSDGDDRTALTGASIALAALDLLKSVNVDLEEAPAAPKGHRAAGVPSFEVVIRQNRSMRRAATSGEAPVEWSHRWEVRGHYKHFSKGPIFDANPLKRVEHNGVECVRVWCPPFVKGPEDKPFVPKARRVGS